MTREAAPSIPARAAWPDDRESDVSSPEQSPIVDTTTLEADALGEAETDSTRDNAVRKHLRGSGVLFVGRLMSKWINFAVQVLVVRILSQSDYGALAYALSIVNLLQQVAAFGLDQSITRFVPMYQEQKRYNRLFGTVLMSLGTVLVTSAALVVAIYAGQGLLRDHVIEDKRALGLLLLLAFLIPIQSIDSLLLGMFAVFASPGAIFFRRHVLSPTLKLVVLVSVMLAGYGVYVVASGYLVAELTGLTVSVLVLWHYLRRQKLVDHFRWSALDPPWKELFAFTIPLVSAEFLFLVLPSINVILLEKFGDLSAVAAYRAVIPLVLLIDLVKASFSPLFMPSAARMLARHDREGINNLYWHSAIWIAVIAYPVFVMTFSIAKPLVLLLYGTRYENSGVILALLSLGLYIDTAMGFNALVLKVYGRLRFVLLANGVTMAINLALGTVLIPRYGAVGAGVATAITWTAHGVLNQLGLVRGTGIRLFDPRCVYTYVTIALSALAVWLLQEILSPPIYISIALAAISAFVVVRLNSRALQAKEVFPELMRIPLAKWLLGRR